MKINLTLNSNGLADRIEKTSERGCIDVQNPSIPNVLLPIVRNYVEGKPIDQKVRVIPTSGQMWQELTHNEKEALLELVELTGVRAEDYCRLWQSQLPRPPRGKE